MFANSTLLCYLTHIAVVDVAIAPADNSDGSLSSYAACRRRRRLSPRSGQEEEVVGGEAGLLPNRRTGSSMRQRSQRMPKPGPREPTSQGGREKKVAAMSW